MGMTHTVYQSQDKTLVITDHYIEKVFDDGFSTEYRFIPIEHLSSCVLRTYNPWWLFMVSGALAVAAGMLLSENRVLGMSLLALTALPIVIYFFSRKQQLVFTAADGTKIPHDTQAEPDLVAKLIKQTLEVRDQRRDEITRSVHMAA